MSNYKRILGNIPIFGSESKFGSLHDTDNKTICKDTLDFYRSNALKYAQGITNLTPEVFNGAMSYLTQLIGYTYAKGVPEHSLNVAYDKGAIVTFKGALYVSLTDNNITHVSQSSHWGKFVIEPNNSIHNTIGSVKFNEVDTNPVGTILTVPVTTTKQGYIDYVEGQTFNQTIYPELFHTLGTNKFAQSGDSSDRFSLPVGSIISWLSSSSDVPNGFVEWTTTYGSLTKYPELLKVLTDMVNRLPLGDSKTAWMDALRTHSLPMFEASGFFLGYGNQVGLYSTDSTRCETLQFPPVVVDSSNTLNPLGYNRCAEQRHAVPLVEHSDVSQNRTESPYIILANRANVHQDVQNKYMHQVVLGTGNETAPKQLAVRLLIKAVTSQPASISSTHKQIIKAY